MTENKNVILEMRGVNKTFGGSAALTNAGFELAPREIHGLLGGNGAGKTTLMNVLYGLYRMDSGEVSMHGESIDIQSPKDAISHRIGMVHQHFLQIRSFTVIQNIILGTAGSNRFSLNLENEEKVLGKLCQRFGLDIDLNTVVEDLPIGVRQKVEILKALYRGVEILILDEPTTNLTPQEVDSLFQSLRVMVDEGMSIVFITHKLREVLGVCDRITVLRNGKNVMTLRRDEASEEAFVRAMVGDEMNLDNSVMFAEKGIAKEKPWVTQPAVIEVKQAGLVSEDNIPRLKAVNLAIHAQEILGVAGVAGNGQRELAEVLVGVQPASSGQVLYHGEDITTMHSAKLLDDGVGYIPEDRLHDGFLPKASVAQNLILGYHREEPYAKNGFMDWKKISSVSRELISEYNIKTLGPDDIGANLSGGNIQRVMIARACAHPIRFLVAHNPTRGLDIPSMDSFYTTILDRKKQGLATLLISENLDELLLLCDRIAVLYGGEVMGILERDQFEKYEIGRMMSGVRTVA